MNPSCGFFTARRVPRRKCCKGWVCTAEPPRDRPSPRAVCLWSAATRRRRTPHLHQPPAAPVEVVDEDPEPLELRVAGLLVVVAVVDLLRDDRQPEQPVYLVERPVLGGEPPL